MKIRLSKAVTSDTRIQFYSKELSKTVPDFNGEPGEIQILYTNNQTTICCGIGESSNCTRSIIRTAAAKGIQKARDLKRKDVAVIPPSEDFTADAIESSLEGTILGSYKFSKYKTDKPHDISTCEFISTKLSTSDFKRISTISDSVILARDLVNDNAEVVTPEFLAERALQLKSEKISVSVLREKELVKQGLNLLYNVGKGSKTPPRLIIIKYIGAQNSADSTAIIGKGITFDSGGQNLKPTGSIETMREDMAGAAAVLGTMHAISVLKPKINVTGVIAAAHNAIGNESFFPGDIYKAYSGKTVEIWSTDAEGRLVLADAVSYVIKNHAPSRIIDLATLTGGILIALGDIAAGLFSNNDILAENLFEIGEKTGERLWRLPLFKEYSDALKGDLGDLRNISKMKKGHASSIIGAAFIQEFVESTHWAHIDIAGTAYNEGQAKGEIPQFGTGFGVRLLTHFLLANKV